MSLDLLLPVVPPQNRKDYSSDQEVRWCPGCGDYSILAQMQKVLPELGIPRENFVFVSGIGCSSRFPYYMDTYGIHSIHGRAPTLASGLKIARPDLHVFIISGDGDGFSIGGNHLLHVLRRNVNVTLLLFNNRIYGLTKGQYSPTSLHGAKTKSSPMGSVENPLNPMSVALAAEATFVARSVDTDIKHLGEMMKQAILHKGASFIEIMQNCNIFNDGAWDHVKDNATKKNNTLVLEHGKPMVFGNEANKGIRLNARTMIPEVVEIGGGVSAEDLMVHDQNRSDATLAYLLSRFTFPEFPVPIGVFRAVEHELYEDGLMAQVAEARKLKGKGDLRSLLCSSDLWSVGPDGSENHTLTRSSAELEEEMLKGWEFGYSQQALSAVRKKLKDVSLTRLPQVASGASLKQALEVMKEHGCPSCVVVDGQGCYAATLTPGDLLRVATLAGDPATVTVEQVATCKDGYVTVGSSLNQAIQQMARLGQSAITVVDQDLKPQGWLTAAAAEAAL
ncbi:MAG: thiamine pyrophosphate-dependent enzyme [Vulcanimicrobiota bacterium]